MDDDVDPSQTQARHTEFNHAARLPSSNTYPINLSPTYPLQCELFVNNIQLSSFDSNLPDAHLLSTSTATLLNCYPPPSASFLQLLPSPNCYPFNCDPPPTATHFQLRPFSKNYPCQLLPSSNSYHLWSKPMASCFIATFMDSLHYEMFVQIQWKTNV